MVGVMLPADIPTVSQIMTALNLRLFNKIEYTLTTNNRKIKIKQDDLTIDMSNVPWRYPGNETLVYITSAPDVGQMSSTYQEYLVFALASRLYRNEGTQSRMYEQLSAEAYRMKQEALRVAVETVGNYTIITYTIKQVINSGDVC